MAALEHRILTQLLIDGTLQTAVESGLTEEEFKDAEARAIWKYLRNHWFQPSTYHTLPTLAAIQRRYPSFRRTAAESNKEKGALRALIRDLKITSYETDIRGLATYFQELVDADPENAAEQLLSQLSQLVCRRDKSETIGLPEILSIGEEHYRDAKDGAIYGLPWPWDPLTADTLGKNPGDFIVMYSRMKQMKTWVALYCAAHDYLHNNARVLFWSREMGKVKAALRLASILGGVDYQMFKRGKLPPPVLRRMREIFRELRGDDFRYRGGGSGTGREFRLLAGRNAPISLDQIVQEIQVFSADVGYLDAFYHIDPGGKPGKRWEKLATLGERCKIISEDESLPLIAVHQANRLGDKAAGSTMADVADSDVLAREASLVMRIVKNRNRQLMEEDYEQWWKDNPDCTEEDYENVLLKAELAEEALIEEQLNDDDIIGIAELIGARDELEEEEGKELKPRRPRKVMHTPWSKPKKASKPAKKKKDDGKDYLVRHKVPDYETPRLGTELGLVLSGNRDGTLEAIVINAIPGYDFSFVSSDYSVEDIEAWLDKDSKKGAKARPKKVSVKTDADSLKKFAEVTPEEVKKSARGSNAGRSR